ncbi:MAG TPA: hypothetical protein VIW64_03830 [Pyrinomonadaceae bacterium]|jgi:hypothetical protein
MNEAARKQRNQQRLTECFPKFAARVDAVIKDLEAQGIRPRIQDAHRTIAAQKDAFDHGFSKVLFGFHNVTGAGGKAESLAVDLLDDDHPKNPPRKYIILLAEAAQAHGLHPGSFFGLPQNLRAGLTKAIQDHNFDPKIKIGFDPTHIEATGLSIAEAKAGKRPS